jgi:hypothetical protein
VQYVGSLADGDAVDITMRRTGNAGAGNVSSVATDGSMYGGPITSTGTLGVKVPITPQGRLTLTSGTPITTSDVTGATTLYYTPMIGRYVPIYDGTQFVNTDIAAELSNITTNSATGKAGPAAVANNSVYDLFVWNDAGTVRLTRGPAWSSDTARGSGAGTSEITQVNGVWVNAQAITNGPAANRGTLVGSVRSDGTAQLKDTKAFRWVSNIYNAVPRQMQVLEATASWNYTLAAFRQANGSAANQLDFLQSLAGGVVSARVQANMSNTSAGIYAAVGIDLDTLNTTTLVNNTNFLQYTAIASNTVGQAASYNGYPGMGRHVLIWKEYSQASGTSTWSGTTALLQSGILGEVLN